MRRCISACWLQETAKRLHTLLQNFWEHSPQRCQTLDKGALGIKA